MDLCLWLLSRSQPESSGQASRAHRKTDAVHYDDDYDDDDEAASSRDDTEAQLGDSTGTSRAEQSSRSVQN